MKFWDLVRIANRNLFRNKLRTLLTIAAIFVGSFTLTMTNGVGDGMRAYVEQQVKNIEGESVVFIRKKVELPDAEKPRGAPREYKEETKPAAEGDATDKIDPTATTATLAQVQNVLKDVPGVSSITPHYLIDGEYITLDGQKKYEVSLGMLSEGMKQKTEAGTSITGPNQIVIPLMLARSFDENISNLVGQNVTIGYKGPDDITRARQLKIVGVATKGFMTNVNSFVDTGTAASIYREQRRDPAAAERFYSFTVQLASADEKTVAQLKQKLNDKGLEAETMADRDKRTYDAIGIFKVVMGLVAMIALLAASFGIINTLVIAVLERTKEIGLQKALGMSRWKIFAIFSLESVLIGFWGALLGTVAGIVIGLVANRVLIAAYAESFEGFSLFAFTIPSMAFVMALISLIAFVAGVLPAWRASRLDPIESLRYE
jgi:putative ABC transport system permease protein